MSKLDDIFREIGFPDPPAVPPPPPRQEPRKPPERGPCGKSMFLSERSAKEAIRYHLNNHGNTTFLRPYFCEICRAWHMTSVPNNTKR